VDGILCGNSSCPGETINYFKSCGSCSIAQSFSSFLARDGQQVCRPTMNFSVTKMQEENKIAQLIF
jgi:hypothetical protein